jgi:class 3 adenylate cyclase
VANRFFSIPPVYLLNPHSSVYQSYIALDNATSVLIVNYCQMRIFFLILGLLISGSALLNAQNGRLEQLETEMLAASGPQRVEKLILLATTCIEIGQYDKAIDWAEEADDFSKRIRVPELRARALNLEGKAMVLAGKRKAAGRFDQSNDLLHRGNSPNKNLMLDNLEQLKKIYLKAGDTKDLAEVELQIGRLKGAVVATLPPAAPTPAPPSAAMPSPVTKDELRTELRALKFDLNAGNKIFAEKQAKILEESRQLQAQLAQKEEEISAMSEAQMKSNMMLMQQRFLLDSLSFQANLDSLAIDNWNLALREAESTRNFYFAAMAILFLLAGGSAYSYFRARQNARVLGEKNKIIREEQQRSENLLLNILPALVADELKASGRTNARFFDDASVLFADFVGFSKIAEQLSPQQLVNDLDTCFQAFDQIIAKFGLEKIKTIGDAYMCAGGLGESGGSQMRDMVGAALDMQRWLAEWNDARDQQGKPRYDARIGIHRGPVVAGVVGSKKFAFDIWGDTVNIAARVEQAGESGKINISGEAYEHIREYFPCSYRGKITAKHKGEIDMYFVN